MVPYSLPNGLRNRLFTDIGVEMVAYYDFATIKRKLTYGSNPDEGYVTGHVNYCEKIKNILKKNNIPNIYVTRDSFDTLYSLINYVEIEKDHSLHQLYTKYQLLEFLIDGKQIAYHPLKPVMEQFRLFDSWKEYADVVFNYTNY